MQSLFQIAPASDSAWRVDFRAAADAHTAVRRFASALDAERLAGVRNVQPAADTVLVVCDARTIAPDAFESRLHAIAMAAMAANAAQAAAPAAIEIPVHYGGDLAPDLEALARQHRLTAAEVVHLHTAATYTVSFFGFAPGFAYLDGLPPELATPRHDVPRTQVPAGSVAIGGTYSAIYPQQSPGGWWLIGRTPRRMFRARSAPHAAFALGDRVRFRSVSRREFEDAAQLEDAAAAHDDDAAAPPPGRGLRIETAGLQTTVQDPGRFGLAHLGVSASGAADALALRIGNLLVGNDEAAAALEMTLVGASVVFECDAVIALTGAAFVARCDGVALPWWQSVRVRAGSRLEIGPAVSGARCMLCVRGGIDVAPVLGSRSTHVWSGIGGVGGRALRRGDRVAIGASNTVDAGAGNSVDRAWIESLYAPRPIRVTQAPQSEAFARAAHDALDTAAWSVREQSNRVGVRLAGPALAVPAGAALAASEGAALGAVQVPPDGQPIVLFVEHQTTGGYPKIANVCSVDLHRVAQLRPRDVVRFEAIDMARARRLFAERDAEFVLQRQRHDLPEPTP